MFRQLFISLFFLTFSHCWLIEVNHGTVTPHVTPDVTIGCHHSNDDVTSSTNSDINTIRIQKFMENDQWVTIAEMQTTGAVVKTSLIDGIVTGHVENISNSFITIHFGAASQESIGQFVCEIIGVNQKIIQTKTIVVTERVLSNSDIPKILLKFKEQEMKDNQDLKDELKLLRSSIDRLNLNNQNSKTPDPVVRDWPNGLYSILKPRSGCPTTNTSSWENSSLKVANTKESGYSPRNQKTDTSSSELDMSTEMIGGINYKKIDMCSMVSDSRGPEWPRGAYCVHAYLWTGKDDDKNCPTGLHYGGMLKRYMESVTVNIPGFPNDRYDYYCCRSDGNPATPITLPNKQPFFLYRYGGECQQVAGMNVTNEWLELSKMGGGTRGAFYVDSIKADYSVQARYQICYYSPL